jgi:plasmid stabilization system protein ParE
VTRPALPVVFARRAAQQVETAAAWWRENRPACREAVAEDIVRALAVLAMQPGCGTPARSIKLKAVRRLYLPRLDYFLYYRTASRKLRIEVLAFWHAKRGRAPQL